MRFTLRAAVLSAIALTGTGCPNRGPAAEVSAQAWLNTPGGKPVSLQSLRGQVVVVEFWATWCPPCRTSIPHLVDLYERKKARGLAVIALTDEPQVDEIRGFAEQMKMPYFIGVGSNSGGEYGVSGIPHAVVVSRKGNIAWAGHPMDPAFAKAVEAQLDAE